MCESECVENFIIVSTKKVEEYIKGINIYYLNNWYTIISNFPYIYLQKEYAIIILNSKYSFCFNVKMSLLFIVNKSSHSFKTSLRIYIYICIQISLKIDLFEHYIDIYPEGNHYYLMCCIKNKIVDVVFIY